MGEKEDKNTPRWGLSFNATHKRATRAGTLQGGPTVKSKERFERGSQFSVAEPRFSCKTQLKSAQCTPAL